MTSHYCQTNNGQIITSPLHSQVGEGGGPVLFWLHLPPAKPKLPATGADGSSDLEEGGSVECLVWGPGTEEVLLQGLLSGETLQWLLQDGLRL